MHATRLWLAGIRWLSVSESFTFCNLLTCKHTPVFCQGPCVHFTFYLLNTGTAPIVHLVVTRFNAELFLAHSATTVQSCDIPDRSRTSFLTMFLIVVNKASCLWLRYINSPEHCNQMPNRTELSCPRMSSGLSNCAKIFLARTFPSSTPIWSVIERVSIHTSMSSENSTEGIDSPHHALHEDFMFI